jgi:hypothetical protein
MSKCSMFRHIFFNQYNDDLCDWSSVADPNHFDTDRDPTFHFDTAQDPDTTFQFNIDPDPYWKLLCSYLESF